MIKQLVQNLIIGGAKKATQRPNRGLLALSAFVAIVLSLIIRGILVNIGYNLLMPKLVSTLSADPQKAMSNYRPLTFSESLILVILVSSLVNM